MSLFVSLQTFGNYITLKCFYPPPSDMTMLSSVTLYIMEGSRETFSMNMGEVVMFWI